MQDVVGVDNGGFFPISRESLTENESGLFFENFHSKEQMFSERKGKIKARINGKERFCLVPDKFLLR